MARTATAPKAPATNKAAAAKLSGATSRTAPRDAGTATTEVHAGPAAELDAQGMVMPISATAYPELLAAGTLVCLGACGQAKSAGTFPIHGNRGDGKGRYVECSHCQVARLAANVAARAAGTPTTPRPRAVVPPAAQ